jgi:hypothetical protein
MYGTKNWQKWTRCEKVTAPQSKKGEFLPKKVSRTAHNLFLNRSKNP